MTMLPMQQQHLTSAPAQEALTKRLQGPGARAGEDQHETALGVDVEVRVPRHVGAQHKLPDLVRPAIKQNVQSSASQQEVLRANFPSRWHAALERQCPCVPFRVFDHMHRTRSIDVRAADLL